MSIIFENEFGVYISHAKLINSIYEQIKKVNSTSYCINPDLFRIVNKYKTTKSKATPQKSANEDVNLIEVLYTKFTSDQVIRNIFETNQMQDADNSVALQAADSIHQTGILDLIGHNIDHPVITEINNSMFLFPKNSKFFSKDVMDIQKYLYDKKFDLILLDPPWWNKYIRRKRKASSDAYNMMFNQDLKKLPIEELLKEDGMVVVWCTNSEQHINALLNDIFPKWKVKFAAQWYWIKVTVKGEPVCDFSKPPGKQPYERIIFGSRNRTLPLPEDEKLLVSIPSAVHSHKPPLVEVLNKYIPKNSECLEIFARYLLPGWTSFGNEVLKLQHESVFR